MDEFDNYCIKQDNFNKRVEKHFEEDARAISILHDIVERTSNDVKVLVKHFQMVQTQIDQLSKVQKDLLVNASREKHAYEITTRRAPQLRILYILKGIQKELSKILKDLMILELSLRKRRRQVKLL